MSVTRQLCGKQQKTGENHPFFCPCSSVVEHTLGKGEMYYLGFQGQYTVHCLAQYSKIGCDNNSANKMIKPKHPINDKGQLRIRFMHSGVRFTLSNLGDYDNKVAYKHAQSICDRIALDIVSGNFTPSNNGELALKYHPSSIAGVLRSQGLKKEVSGDVGISSGKSCIVKQLKERLVTKYHSTDKSLLNILTTNDIKLNDEVDAQKFIEWLQTERKLKTSTVQRYLNTLKTCSDLFRHIKVKRSKGTTIVKPFTKEEVSKILQWFVATPYYNYVWFALNTGFRPSEIIGLQWKNVDFVNNVIIVNSVLARDKDHTSKRKRKLPKAEVIRKFPMNNNLLNFMKELSVSDVDKEQLVFLSPKGTNIDDHNFVTRWWRKCLLEVGIEHIDFYNCRRTFISHYLEQTKDVVKCASLTHGTKSGIKTIWEHYAGVINKVEVPELY